VETKPDVIGTKEAAAQLGVSVRTVQLWVEKGTLEAWKTDGGHRRILRSSVEQALQSRTGESPRQSNDGVRVLIVEDDLTVQSYYRALFDILSPDAAVTMVVDGYDALIELGKSKPDLLLVDVNLPHMDGITLLRKIHQSASVNNLQIAVVTGLDEKHLAERGEIPSGIPVHSKPLGIDKLKSIIENLEASVGVAS